MPDSPAGATPYEVLGVSPEASWAELRVAYRRRARQTHPDLGGSAEKFRAVQDAWERVGSADRRRLYDARGLAAEDTATWSSSSGGFARATRSDGRPRARSYGHPGGRTRERYLDLLREWSGRGTLLADPYDPSLVRSAPVEVRRLLAKALAEEETARTVAALGLGFTVWNDVAAPGEEKIDCLILGPGGLFAVRSEDWGTPVQVARGEVVGEGLGPAESPVRSLTRSALAFAPANRMPFTALLIVVPDDATGEALVSAGARKVPTFLVRRSLLPRLVRDGIGGTDRRSLSDIFELRARLQSVIQFV